MYKAKVFSGNSIEVNLNDLFKTFPVDAKIISIEYMTSPKGSLRAGGIGEITAEPKILVVWEE